MTETQTLIDNIDVKRRKVSEYLNKNEPRHSRLITFSIIAGALSATLTAGPGLGGTDFILSAGEFLSLGVPVWQAVCLLATICSVAVVIVNGILKSSDMMSRISQARVCDAKLEGLAVMLSMNQIDLKQAASLYTQYLTEISHIR